MNRIDKKSHVYYDVYPKIVPADKDSKVMIKPIAKSAFDNDSEYMIEIFGMESRIKTEYTVKATDGALEIKHFFKDEQEHSVHIYKDEVKRENKQCIIHLYSLYKDLYTKRPYKGDFHIHSTCSDGQETLEVVCAVNRKEGLDFMTLTDHKRYLPSLEAQKFVNDMNADLAVFPGEEIHFHGTEHILCFGNNEGIGEKYSDTGLFEKEIVGYRKSIKEEIEKLPENIDVERYVACRFVIDKIHEVGGLAIMPHQYWVQTVGHHNASHLFKYFYENKYLDVCELINGYAIERFGQDANNLQVAYYEDQRAKGIEVPIVSGTDSHSSIQNKCIGNMYTVVFSESLDIENIRKNVLEGNTAVVDGTLPYTFGKLRFVKYTLYLIREIFPLHDEICYEEGRVMFRHAAGDKQPLPKGRIDELYSKLW